MHNSKRYPSHKIRSSSHPKSNAAKQGQYFSSRYGLISNSHLKSAHKTEATSFPSPQILNTTHPATALALAISKLSLPCFCVSSLGGVPLCPANTQSYLKCSRGPILPPDFRADWPSHISPQKKQLNY